MSASTQISPRVICAFYAHDHTPDFLTRYKLALQKLTEYIKLYFQAVADLMSPTCSVPGWRRCVLRPRSDLLMPSETAAVWLSDKLAQFNLAQLGSRRCATGPLGSL